MDMGRVQLPRAVDHWICERLYIFFPVATLFGAVLDFADAPYIFICLRHHQEIEGSRSFAYNIAWAPVYYGTTVLGSEWSS